MISYSKLSRKVVGDYVHKFRAYFLDIRADIQMGNLKYTLEEYLSIMFFTILITFSIETILLTFIFALIIQNVLIAMLLGPLLSLVLTGGLSFLFYIYPGTMANTRKRNIEKILPFASSYLSSIASGHVSISTMFKLISKFEEYGEMRVLAKNISRDIEMFGMTSREALKRAAKRTPSSQLRDLLYGMIGIMSSGGDLSKYLQNESNSLVDKFTRKITEYAHSLSLFVEIYLTLLIVGSVFFTILSAIIGIISGGPGTVILQSFVVLILVPLISIGFIVLVKSISPTS